MAYKDVFMLDDDDVYHVCKRCKELGALAMMHAENGHVIANVSNFAKNCVPSNFLVGLWVLKFCKNTFICPNSILQYTEFQISSI